MKNKIKNLFKHKILVLDGAMGTMVQSHNLEESDFRGERFKHHLNDLEGNNDILCITKPNIVADIHKAYFDSGCDIVETNTFNANSISQSDYKLEDYVYKLNFESARIAKKASNNFNDKPRFVAGSVGPTNRTASISPEVNDPSYRNISFDQLNDAYQEQIEALVDGGVDIILIETFLSYTPLDLEHLHYLNSTHQHAHLQDYPIESQKLALLQSIANKH